MNFAKQSFGEKVFDIFNITVMIFLLVIFSWPLIFVLSASLSDPLAVATGRVWVLPVGFNLEAYREILRFNHIWIGYRNTIIYTFFGTILNIVMTICAAYPLSKKDFMPRHFFMTMFLITMYFSGGLIPTYLVVLRLGLVNTIWAMLLPSAVSFFNIIIMRTFFQTSIPTALHEAAKLDGANEAQILLRVVLPLSTPIMAVMALFYGVGRWNSFFDALIYLTDINRYPLQIFLRNILIRNQVDISTVGLDVAQVAARQHLARTIQYGVIVVASVPVLMLYPFAQRYFVKGVMIGSIKG